ncbi:hypothetical protein BIFGAL_04439 [Bifidobacterium gallicum DSM 20093 = LMG 11596]|uniref:Uncharacterized protein n=1 Tax=Bifidobacterium gallicum DSM 20093 = LMG 11596 TaxID=561180 RepID=D1NX31_9BIFI|nr:hypothetical protein BIFGAL_04439 [Bifidobacterium gallicum DSM 20093 = LMG 11596]
MFAHYLQTFSHVSIHGTTCAAALCAACAVRWRGVCDVLVL